MALKFKPQSLPLKEAADKADKIFDFNDFNTDLFQLYFLGKPCDLSIG